MLYVYLYPFPDFLHNLVMTKTVDGEKNVPENEKKV